MGEKETMGEQPMEQVIEFEDEAPLPADTLETVELGSSKRPTSGSDTKYADYDLPNPSTSRTVPSWVKVPPGLKPPKGRQVLFLRFKAAWTDTPHKGDRQAICWSLSDADEKVALMRAITANRTAYELAKQMVRVVDGHVASWDNSQVDGDIDRWWTEIGGKCRQILIRLFAKLHTPSEEERVDFFENCIEVRTSD